MVWCCHPTAWFPSGEQGHGALPAHPLQELQVGRCYCTRQGSHCPAFLWRAKTGLSAHIHPLQTLILYKNCKQVIAIVHGSFSQVQLLCAEQRQGSSAHTHSPKVGGRSLLLYMIGFLPYNFSVGSRLSAHTHSPRIVGRSLLLYMAGCPPMQLLCGEQGHGSMPTHTPQEL